jgi:hypothetical protein
MNVDSSYFLDQKVTAYVQTLGFTGVEQSNGGVIFIGGMPIQTPALHCLTCNLGYLC